MRELASLLLLFAAAAAAQTPGGCLKRILIVTGHSDEPYHHWRETTASIRDILARSGGYDAIVNEEPRGLTTEALQGYDAILVNYNGPRWPRAAERAVESFVSSGGGLFAFHLSAYGPFFGMVFRDGRWQAGDAGWTAWPQLAGMRWDPAAIGHAPRAPFQVEWTKDSTVPAHPASFLANDELYHRITLLAGAHPEATALSPDAGGTGRVEPMAWTARYGKGRVFFTTLGHDAMAFHQPGMRNLVVSGLRSVAGGEPCAAARPNPVRVLVVTGGHSYPAAAFYAMIDSLPNVTWKHATSQAEAFARPLENQYDVVVLHDMYNVTTEQTRDRLRAFVESGKGVVAIHHAIVDYTDWPWWQEEVTGGKYFEKAAPGHEASHYREDVEVIATPVAARRNHSVLGGVGPLTLEDEVYRGMWRSPQIDVLMETAHPENDRPVVYIGPHPKARVVYIQFGHAASTMENPGYRRLVGNAVQWAARRIN